MCVIIVLQPGSMIDKDKLDNAIQNNPHGWGLILRDQNVKRLEVIRRYSDKADYLDEIYDMLNDNKDIQRFLHLRFNTKGETSLDNVHPFPVYHSNSRQVWLMHNGTMNDWSPKNGDTRSDTRIFCEDFLSPYLLGFSGEFGHGDYNNPISKQIIDKMRGTTQSKLLLISNDLDPLEVGYWITIKNKDGTEFRASNNDYFFTAKRGVAASSGAPFQRAGGSNVSTATGGGTTSIVPFSSVKSTATEKSKREIVSLKSLEEDEDNCGLAPIMATSLRHLYGEDNFFNFGVECLDWLKDEEMELIIKNTDTVDLGNSFRNLVRTIADQKMQLDDFENEADVAEMRIKELEKEVARLQEKNKEGGRRIAYLMQQQSTTPPFVPDNATDAEYHDVH